MIIGIDASKTTSKKKTGIDNTAYQIILGLTKIDKINTYYLYTNKSLDPILTKNSNFIEKLIPFPKLWNRFRLPLTLYKDKPDIFLELTNCIPSFAPKKTIVLIHDLAFKFFPDAYSKYELILQENAISIATKKAAAIVFTGKSNLSDFIKFYGKPKAKTTIIPLAYDSNIVNNLSTNKSPEIEDCPYFLSVGRIEKRKNTLNIVRAFELFKEQNHAAHKLILVGKNGFGSEETEKAISNSKFKNDIIKKGYIEDECLSFLYKNAVALLYPSLYEGFGLPILEAMASGTPVLTSDIPTIKDVARDGALLVDPQNIEEISEGMKKLALDKNIQSSIITKGYDIIKEYSWDKTAKEFYKIINTV